MAAQYREAVESLKEPELRKQYEREQRNFMEELVEAANKHPTISRRVHIPEEQEK